ncbi:hypothetical protein VDG1235_4335 [Verrucomicrobiia bacterium DG1235]|nr:hypothetical protein VDG1235_4335 [Verrucomicrobiae bacterium DG1235]
MSSRITSAFAKNILNDIMKNYLTIKEFESSIYADWEITKKIQEDGWKFISTRIIRPKPRPDGSFEEELIYVLGHESSNP